MAGLTVLFRFLYEGFMRDRQGRLTDEWHYQKRGLCFGGRGGEQKQRLAVRKARCPRSGDCTFRAAERETMTLVMDLHSWQFAQAGSELIQLPGQITTSREHTRTPILIGAFPSPSADPIGAFPPPPARGRTLTSETDRAEERLSAQD
ncbi:hypothetical protein SKAU_G00401670 [Synaphobranchus kaupii]|uniref:Uncharacterized protein n=1 Tax=Synaphobranchus kaupii TaxID=118154 RepID=A0A9Q1IAF0_SYNKA|nr:hypothetical protein SKAU_G00401670 [Synaphobranchus kaupii]